MGFDYEYSGTVATGIFISWKRYHGVISQLSSWSARQKHRQADRQTLCLQVRRTVGHSLSQSVSKCVRQSLCRPVSVSASLSLFLSSCMPISQSVSQSARQPASQPFSLNVVMCSNIPSPSIDFTTFTSWLQNTPLFSPHLSYILIWVIPHVYRLLYPCVLINKLITSRRSYLICIF
jgi:hypothetical protein